MTPEQRIAQWNEAGGDELLYRDLPLNSESVVWEVGGWQSKWGAEILHRYNPVLQIFEPQPQVAEGLRHKYFGHERVHVLPYALAMAGGPRVIELHGQRASLIQTGDQCERMVIECLNVAKIFKLWKPDLMHLNCEGAEYEILSTLSDQGLLGQLGYLQVQFHEGAGSNGSTPFPWASTLPLIQRRLAETHRLVFRYDYVWEAWERR